MGKAWLFNFSQFYLKTARFSVLKGDVIGDRNVGLVAPDPADIVLFRLLFHDFRALGPRAAVRVRQAQVRFELAPWIRANRAAPI